MNNGTYIGVGGLLIALVLWYMRAVRPIVAAGIAVVAIGVGWWQQPAKEEKKKEEPGSG